MSYKHNNVRPDVIPYPRWGAILAPCLRNVERSTLYQSLALTGMWSQKRIYDIMTVYAVGATDDGITIFPQIDSNYQLRTARYQTYSYDGKPIGRQQWLHYYLKRQGLLPETFALAQCPFGEYELTVHPDDTVCIVPDEASTLTCKLNLSEFVWLGVGRSLRLDMLGCLRGRNVLMYPDSDLYEEWRGQAKQIRGCKSLQVVQWHRPDTRADTFAEWLIENHQKFHRESMIWHEIKRQAIGWRDV